MFHKSLTRITASLREDLCAFMISRSIILRVRYEYLMGEFRPTWAFDFSLGISSGFHHRHPYAQPPFPYGP